MRRFQIGDRVVYDPGTKNHVAPDGVYDIVAVLPREDNVDEYLYRIKSVKEQRQGTPRLAFSLYNRDDRVWKAHRQHKKTPTHLGDAGVCAPDGRCPRAGEDALLLRMQLGSKRC
jgi:ribosomal protein L11 methylase PrmA